MTCGGKIITAHQLPDGYWRYRHTDEQTGEVFDSVAVLNSEQEAIRFGRSQAECFAMCEAAAAITGDPVRYNTF